MKNLRFKIEDLRFMCVLQKTFNYFNNKSSIFNLQSSIIFNLAVLVGLSGCFATHTAITKRNLDVQTKMSETIFLDPVADSKKVVYIKIRNTSGRNSLDLQEKIKAAVMEKGYRITPDPVHANFILQANVLQAGKNENSQSLSTGFGDAIIPAVIGGVAGNEAGGDAGMVIGAAAGAAVGFIGSTLVQDTTYSIITDIEVSQKAGISPVTTGKKDAKKEAQGGWKKYTTRIASYANQVNLEYEEAEPELVKGLVGAVAGVL